MAERTKVPGVDSNEGTQTNVEHQRATGHGFGETPNYGMPHSGMADKGTTIPGMGNFNEPSNQPSQNVTPGKPIIGFLVSVSRTEAGEYWVLYQGQNSVGSGPNCNVVLPEASVSGVHAILAAHRNPNNDNKLNVGIIDRGSSNGTIVNDNYIGFEACQCKNGDKIKIGNYELLLLLFDVVEYKMTKVDNFISKEEEDYSDRNFYPGSSAPVPDSTRL